MGAPLCHFEFMTDDPNKSKAFYADIFGWEFDDSAMPGYTMIRTGQEPEGGLMKRPPEAPAPSLITYFQVDDIEATLAKVQQGGGKVVVPKTPIPNVGAYAVFLDPENICVGVFQK
ncbi:MAG: VOC family protein [bacterium]|nr:VOC family protein [bacterium]